MSNNFRTQVLSVQSLQVPVYMLKKVIAALLLLVVIAGCGTSSETVSTDTNSDEAAIDQNYWVYVGAESEDLIHRIRFGPDGAEVENTTPVGEIFNKIEGPHGLAIDDDGEYLYFSTGHGDPDGKFWKMKPGPDEIVEDPILLGRFPATVDVTPDGEYAFIVNFNLHGEMVPSTTSVVYLPDFYEVAQTEVGVMPHGSRISPDGNYQYSGLMMDDLLVELDAISFEVNRCFNVAEGEEGPVEDHPYPHDEHAEGNMGMDNHMHEEMHQDPTCSPTWAQPSTTGEHVYVACNASDRVLEIDVEAWELSRTFETGTGPYNIDISPDNRTMVVTLKQGDGVEIIDLESEEHTILDSSTSVTHGVIISPDSRFAFASVEGIGGEPGIVDVYDLQTKEKVDSVETGKQASGIDFWKMEPVGSE